MSLRLGLFFGFLLFVCVWGRPNFVFVLTDDQDVLLDGMLPMRQTLKLVANAGKTFKNAFVNSPICCPNRGTILTGKYPHNHNLVNNSLSGNCCSGAWQKNQEPASIANLLKLKGEYLTFYAGKYLNQYGTKPAGGVAHVPPGYDWWAGLVGNSKYYNYTLSLNGTAHFFSDVYLTDLLSEYAQDFLKIVKKRHFFMMIATPSCHAPFTPARRHKSHFLNVTAPRTASFNATHTNKHWIMQIPPTKLPENVTILDDIQKHRLQTLLSVDELIENLVKTLKKLKIFENTYFIVTSDNGFHIGQFTQPWDKRQPYQTDIKVPFIIKGPKIPKKTLTNFPISSVDILPTILDLAEVTPPSNLKLDGRSFKDELTTPTDEEKWGKRIFVEYYGEANPKSIENCPQLKDRNLAECSRDNWCKCQDSRNNTYTCLLDLTSESALKFCRFRDGRNFTEMYDLVADPHELDNISDGDRNSDFEKILDDFIVCSGLQCQ